MQFSDATTKQGLIEDIDFLCGSTSATYPVADKARNINIEYHNVSRLIWEAQDGWSWDDRDDYPKILGTMTHDTQDYKVATLSSVARHIQRVEVKDNNGHWHKLKPRDLADISFAKDEYLKSPGLPVYYDLEGDYLSLFPPPHSASTTLISGLGLYVTRDATEFATTATTAVPGFAPQFHRILSVAASLDFERDPDQRKLLLQMKVNLRRGLQRFYAKRNVELRRGIKPLARKRWRQYL